MEHKGTAVIKVYFTQLDKAFSAKDWQLLMDFLPEDQQHRINRFHFWQDRHRSLLGRLLLRQGLQEAGFCEDIQSNIRYSHYQRPQLDDEVDFNISHSGEYVLCAVSQHRRVGVDVEQIKHIDLSDFRNTMTQRQLNHIGDSANPIVEFFRLWTLKESVIKANGKGLSIPLNQLETDYCTLRVEDWTWNVTPLELSQGYCGYLAYDGLPTDFEWKYCQFSE